MRRVIAGLLFFVIAWVAPAQTVLHDQIYLKQGGVAFTMDVFMPEHPNGAGIVFLISGGWFSAHEMINPGAAKPLTDAGFTVFEVVHGSQPRYIIPEIVNQLHRAIRFVRANASLYKIEPNRIGVTGISSGGHLTLMLAGTGDDGNAGSSDPVEHQSSKVQAAVAFMPPTDFLNWGSTGSVPYDDKKLTIFLPAFGATAQASPEKRLQVAKSDSPITYVSDAYPPTLIIHGDKDMLVPIQQSQTMSDALEAHHVKHKFISVPGGGHDGITIGAGALPALRWFQQYLIGAK